VAKIGIYGGSFNPVHFGHVGLSQWVISHTDLDELWLMVSPNNPMKPSHLLAPEDERLKAVKEAIRDIEGLVASDFEFHLPRPSYTAHTLRELQKAYPQDEFTLVIGEDNLAIFDQWKEYEYILTHFRILVYPRHEQQTAAVQNAESLIARLRAKGCIIKEIIYLSDAPYFDISSTQIRNKTE